MAKKTKTHNFGRHINFDYKTIQNWGHFKSIKEASKPKNIRNLKKPSKIRARFLKSPNGTLKLIIGEPKKSNDLDLSVSLKFNRSNDLNGAVITSLSDIYEDDLGLTHGERFDLINMNSNKDSGYITYDVIKSNIISSQNNAGSFNVSHPILKDAVDSDEYELAQKDKDYTKYRRKVDRLTRIQIKIHSEKIENFELLKFDQNMTIDHKYSVLQGYKDNISEEIIAHHSNLEVMCRSTNSSKGSKCSVSKDMLIENYQKSEILQIAI